MRGWSAIQCDPLPFSILLHLHRLHWSKSPPHGIPLLLPTYRNLPTYLTLTTSHHTTSTSPVGVSFLTSLPTYIFPFVPSTTTRQTTRIRTQHYLHCTVVPTSSLEIRHSAACFLSPKRHQGGVRTYLPTTCWPLLALHLTLTSPACFSPSPPSLFLSPAPFFHLRLSSVWSGVLLRKKSHRIFGARSFVPRQHPVHIQQQY